MNRLRLPSRREFATGATAILSLGSLGVVAGCGGGESLDHQIRADSNPQALVDRLLREAGLDDVCDQSEKVKAFQRDGDKITITRALGLDGYGIGEFAEVQDTHRYPLCGPEGITAARVIVKFCKDGNLFTELASYNRKVVTSISSNHPRELIKATIPGGASKAIREQPNSGHCDSGYGDNNADLYEFTNAETALTDERPTISVSHG